VNYKNKKEENSLENSSFVQSCKNLKDYRTREDFVSTIAAEEMKNATRFKEDFLKVVEFVHYLQEGVMI
jgi:hypothetical protein